MINFWGLAFQNYMFYSGLVFNVILLAMGLVTFIKIMFKKGQ